MTAHHPGSKSSATSLVADLRLFFAGLESQSSPDVVQWLHKAVPDSAFYWPDGMAQHERLSLCYVRSRAAGRSAPPAKELIRDPRALAALLTRLAVADPVMFHICLVHYTLVLAPILESDPDAERNGLRDIRSDLESMASFGAALITESSRRSNSHLHPCTRATFDPANHDFVLDTPDGDAAKFPNNTGHPAVAKTGAVYAQLVVDGHERGMFVFIVSLRGPDGTVAPGVELTAAPDSFALASDYTYVRFNRMRIPFHTWLPDGATLDAHGGFHDPERDVDARRTRTMSIGAPLVWRSIIAASAGVTQGAAQILHTHVKDHVTMGRLAPAQPLGRYRPVQETRLGAVASAYVLAIVANHTTGRRPAQSAHHASEAIWAPWSAVDRELPLFKVIATRTCADIVERCRACCGANGFTAYNRLNAFHGWAHAYTAAGGDNSLILLDTAHGMAALNGYQPPAPEPAIASTADLTEPSTWLPLARAAEHELQRRLVISLETSRNGGADEFTAWNENLTLARTAASVHADRLLLELLSAVHDTAPNPVGRLLRLYGLAWIEDRAAILMDMRLVPPDLLDRVWSRRRGLCDELEPHIADLVGVFDFPDLCR
ncbi:acyl-CoA dehydrogenase family protein [Nocardia sp. NBC_00508]|uniref:acyl-CoA dehydrogenase n=1 Tax=Nocardia sp. NBC_00508 TaxID=2975992 RepID=UPI002E80DE53|nr:acyl-CoA dehydrogenase [Nocardia sp. NBC_00508]WUD65859.1 acyl-CoA dehydrogenase family protein [Nocardia sp. NBC_00508]